MIDDGIYAKCIDIFGCVEHLLMLRRLSFTWPPDTKGPDLRISGSYARQPVFIFGFYMCCRDYCLQGSYSWLEE